MTKSDSHSQQAPGSRAGAVGHLLRAYRAGSWIRRAARLPEADLDGRFIFSWIAFNALYGQARYRQRQDASGPDQARAPSASEHREIATFLSWVARTDAAGVLARAVARMKNTPGELLADPFLDDRNWEKWDREGRVVKPDREQAVIWKNESGTVLQRLFLRLYVLRKQIFHGCSTDGGKRNRDSLRRAVVILEATVPLFRDLVQVHGAGVPFLEKPPYQPSQK